MDVDKNQNIRILLEKRVRIVRTIRKFFEERGFLEVETPVRLPCPPPEVYIQAEPSGPWFLRTSPELHMKRLLAAGCDRIFQLGACFRQGERGPRHHPEYSMLEWYRTNADSGDILADTKALIQRLAMTLCGRDMTLSWQGHEVHLGPAWEHLTVSQAFIHYAGWDPTHTFDAHRFDLDLVDKVEPALARIPVPVILSDYPAEAAALAQRRPAAPHLADRWELYIGGMELANAYTELTDVTEQKARFQQWNKIRRETGRTEYPLDENFLEALRQGMPPCGGIALGVDRLVMLFVNAATIDEVLPFARDGRTE